MGAHLSLQQRDSSSSLAAPTRRRASLHQGDGAGPLADCAPLWRCLRWSRSRTRPAGARCRGAPLVEGAGGQQQFRHCWGSAPLPQSAPCSAPPMGAHLSLQPHDYTSSFPVAAPPHPHRAGWRHNTQRGRCALVRTGRELAPTSAARRNKPLSNMLRRPRAEAAGSVQERGGTAAARRRPSLSHEHPRRGAGRSWTEAARVSRWLGAGFAAGSSAWQRMARRWLEQRQQGGGTGCGDSGRSRDWQTPRPVQERGGKERRSSAALVSPHTHAAPQVE